ncbi:MAG: glycosyltransferase family 4 protein [Verrucomicrobiota bacterium]
MKIVILINENIPLEQCMIEYSEQNPLGGSMTSALWMAQNFRLRGHEVIFFNDAEMIGHGVCDIFISLRGWRVFFLEKRPGKCNYLWCKDDFDQPFLEPLRDRELATKVFRHVDCIPCVSHYQAQQWIQHCHAPPEKIWVTTNGIPSEYFQTDASTLHQRPSRAYYASTPFRGLEMLLNTWPMIHSAVPEAELWVYSSIRTYGHHEKPEHMIFYEKARAMENARVRYMGSVGQKELRAASTQCRVLAYPSIFAETSCIAAMEAMASGCVVVSTTHGALAETAWRNPLTPLTENWLEDWAFKVCRVLVDNDYYLYFARHNLHVAQQFDWANVADRWLQKFKIDLRSH